MMPCAAAGEENLPLLGAPGMIMIRLEPILCTCPKIRFCADCPIDMSTITDAMPMTMPSMVNSERILPCMRLRVAVLKASLNSILFERTAHSVMFSNSFVALYHAVFYHHYTVGKLGCLGFVRYHQHGASFFVEVGKYLHHLQARL